MVRAQVTTAEELWILGAILEGRIINWDTATGSRLCRITEVSILSMTDRACFATPVASYGVQSYYAVMQNDGNFCIYYNDSSGKSQYVWSIADKQQDPRGKNLSPKLLTGQTMTP
jgi:hypothetical protein